MMNDEFFLGIDLQCFIIQMLDFIFTNMQFPYIEIKYYFVVLL
jgi:hypothetical protein